MEGIKKLLAERIRDLRKSRGMTQEKLAERTGLTTTHVGHIETGRRWPSAKVLDRLAAVLGGPEAILSGRGEILAPTPEQALEVFAELVAKGGRFKTVTPKMIDEALLGEAREEDLREQIGNLKAENLALKQKSKKSQ